MGGEPGIWLIPVVGGEARMLRQGAAWPSVSPDGERIAFVAGSAKRSALWIMNAIGDQARMIQMAPEGVEISSLVWSPDGLRLAYIGAERGRGEERFAMETCAVRGGTSAVVVSDPRLEDGYGNTLPLVWLPDGTIVYSRAELPPDDHESNLWQIRVNRGGRRVGEPRRLTRWAGASFTHLTGNSDGTKLACIRSYSQADVYVAQLEAVGMRLSAARRLTRDNRNAWPAEWTRDSRSVLFVSDRAGNRDVFLQRLDQSNPQALVVGPAQVWEPCFSPDGRWLMYWTSPEAEDRNIPSAMSLVRVPRSGGPTEPVLEAASQPRCRCSRTTSNRCVLSEVRGRQLVFTAFDPVGGRGAELLRLEISDDPLFGWDLSPDGSRIAFVDQRLGGDRIRLLDLRGGPEREVRAGGWSELQSVAWLSKEDGWFVTSWSPQGVSLLHVDPTGRTRSLRTSPVWLGRPVASPDGRYLAFAEHTMDANVWLIEGL